jgi:hypothetical protein
MGENDERQCAQTVENLTMRRCSDDEAALKKGLIPFIPSPIFRTLVFEARPPVPGFPRQPSGGGANTWANSWAGVGKPNCRSTRLCSALSRVACTTRPRRLRRPISP